MFLFYTSPTLHFRCCSMNMPRSRSRSVEFKGITRNSNTIRSGSRFGGTFGAPKCIQAAKNPRKRARNNCNRRSSSLFSGRKRLPLSNCKMAQLTMQLMQPPPCFPDRVKKLSFKAEELRRKQLKVDNVEPPANTNGCHISMGGYVIRLSFK